MTSADPDLECLKETGKSYRGTASQTKTGQRCLPWDFPVLRSKVYNAWRSDAVDLGLASHSYCRSVFPANTPPVAYRFQGGI